MGNSADFTVAVQQEDFDTAALQAALISAEADAGAVVCFTGYVRHSNDERRVQAMELEHYPGMTERSIHAILQQASERWPVLSASVLHRVGRLVPGDQIVWVGVSSAHRSAAYSACEFIMDYLKTRAPFWKKEIGPDGDHWVDARAIDGERAGRWGK